MIRLSEATRKHVRCLFPAPLRDTVEKYLLESCGDNLPGVASDYLQLAERIRFAVLKLSEGDLHKLQLAIEALTVDWRDTLVSAGFASDTEAHLAWQPECRKDLQ